MACARTARADSHDDTDGRRQYCTSGQNRFRSAIIDARSWGWPLRGLFWLRDDQLTCSLGPCVKHEPKNASNWRLLSQWWTLGGCWPPHVYVLDRIWNAMHKHNCSDNN